MFFSDRSYLWIAAGCYLVGLILGSVSLLRERRHSRVLMYNLLALGFVVQTLGLGLRGKIIQGCPITNIFEILQFGAWATAALYLLIGATFRLSMLGYFSSSLMALLTLVSLSIPVWDTPRALPHPMNPWVATHAGIAMFGYGVFGMLSLTSLLYLLRHHSLRSKQLGGWFSFLPPLHDLEKITYRLNGMGVVLMSLALGIGYMFWRLDGNLVNYSKIFAVVGVWFGYSLILALRVAGKLVGARYAWACALLYLAALFSLWPVNQSRHPVVPETQAELRQKP